MRALNTKSVRRVTGIGRAGIIQAMHSPSIHPLKVALRDAAILWLVGSVRHEAVVRAACDVLAAGLDGDHLSMVAGTSTAAQVSVWEFGDLVRRAVEDTGGELPEPESTMLEEAALGAMARRVVAGAVTPREFSSWAHRVIGHEGASGAQSIVELDDALDLAQDGIAAESVAEVEARIRAEAEHLAGLS